MDQNQRIVQLAADLDRALLECAVIPPITTTDPDLDGAAAYAIQLRNVDLALSRGAVITGKKIGLTSLAMQKLLGLSEPDYGHLFDSMDMTGRPIPTQRLIQPKAEAEIAFILREDLRGPGVSEAGVLAATEAVVAAIEIVDSRIQDWKIQLVDTVADNASAALYIVGEKRLSPAEIDLPAETLQFYLNGQLLNQGTGADVMGNPARAVAWLANKLSEYGVALKKGEVILSGALTGAAPARPGDRFEAVFGRLGAVAAQFA